MVKLKRRDEAQLNLFSWKPKSDVPINAPKVPSIKEVPTENNTGGIEDTYSGKEDIDSSKWFTESFLNKKYKEFNSQFFNSRKKVNESEDSNLEIDSLIKDLENIPNVQDIREKDSFIYIDID